jgi:peptidyl-prolyl cis-trans isomerase D
MLDVLRRGASTWISKLLLGLLIVSFGIWGIADVFRGFGSNVAFKVGSTEIGIGQFDQMFQRELHQLSLRLKRPFNKDRKSVV